VISERPPVCGGARAAQLAALMQIPHRFRSKRQLWTYSGLAVETHDSAQYRYVDEQPPIRRLNIGNR
jgi:transposase